ncbi:hypothetical protein ACFVX3_19305 [Rhodococcus erythropolis]
MKRYLLADNADGQSHVVSVVEFDDADGKIHIWKDGLAELDEERVAAIVVESGNEDLQPGPHGLNVMVNQIPPDRDRERHGYAQRPIHRTRTIDIAYVLGGELHLQLDLERAVLRAGDAAILCGVNHLWFNPTDHVATMLNFLYEPR